MPCLYVLQTRRQHQPSTMSHNTSLDGTRQLYADDGQSSDDSTSVDTPPATGKRDSADKTGYTDLQRRRSPTPGALTQGTQLIVNEIYPLIWMGVSTSQTDHVAKRAAPWLPDDIRKVAALATETAIKRAKRDVCRYLPTSDDLDLNNNYNTTSKGKDPDATNTSADNVERQPIELLSQRDMDIFSEKFDDINKSSLPDITEGPEPSQPEERRGEFRQYPLDKIRQNYTVKKATSLPAATLTMAATGTPSSQQHAGILSDQPQYTNVEMTAPTTTLESANNDDTTEQPVEHHPRYGQRFNKRKRDLSVPTTSPYGSAVDTRPGEHSTRSVDRPSVQVERLMSTPSRTRIPPTNYPVVKQRAETYQRTNVAAPAYEEHRAPAFQRPTTEAQDLPTYLYNSVTKCRQQQQPDYQLSREDQRPGDNNGDEFDEVMECLKAIWDQRGEKHPTSSLRQVRTGQSVTRHGNTNWATDRPRQRRQEGTSESCSDYDSDWNDRDERTSRNRNQSGRRSITFCRGTNWFRDDQARREGRNPQHSRGKVARSNRVTNWRRDVHEGHERKGSSTVCHGRANSTHARRRF